MEEQSNSENLQLKKTSYVKQVKIVVVQEKTANDCYLNSPDKIYDLSFLRDELILSDREKFICLHLNIKNRLISWEVVSIGSLNASIVHPREVFKGAILVNAASIILCHNHPSGDPEPSTEDISLTKRLKEAADIIGIPVLDHVVIAEESYISLKERGIL